MPTTEIKSCNTPASDRALPAALACPLATACLPLACSQVAVCLLKYSDDDSRRLGTCFVRAMAVKVA